MSTMYVNKVQELNVGSGVHIPGHVIQIENVTYSTETGTTSTTFSDTGLSVTFTPKFSDSKILILFSLGSSGVNNTAAEARGYYRLMRDSTELYRMDVRAYDYGNSGSIQFSAMGQSYVDTPSTTSSIVYKIQQRSSTGTIRVCEANNQIHMQVMEIAQ
tara:strand:+ start:7623 stop:8099 length:477 start_codon:yes stop_codon:yes gene_type:complete